MGFFAKRLVDEPVFSGADGNSVGSGTLPDGGAEGSGGPAADISLLPGMPEDYVLTQEQIDRKKEIAEDLLPALGIMRPGVAYVEDEFIFSAEDKTEARLIAEAYDGELESFEYGIGVARIREGSPYTLKDLFAACADTGNNLPPIELNIIYHTE